MLERYSARTLERHNVQPFYQRHHPKWMVAFAIGQRAKGEDGQRTAMANYLALPLHIGRQRNANARTAL